MSALATEQRLLLDLAWPEGVDRPHVDPPVAGFDWDGWLALALLHRVVELIRRRHGDGDPLGVPAAVAERMAQVCEETRVRNTALLDAADEVVSASRGAGIQVLVRKGLPLVHRVYGDYTARSMYDVDLLVRRADVDAFRELLPPLGYTEGFGSPEGIQPWNRQTIVGWALTGVEVPGWVRLQEAAGQVDLSITTGLFERTTGYDVPVDDVFERSIDVVIEGRSIPAMADPDAVVDACGRLAIVAAAFDYIPYGPEAVALYKLCDIAGLARALDSSEGLDGLVALCERYGVTKPVADALGPVDAVFPGAVPPGAPSTPVDRDALLRRVFPGPDAADAGMVDAYPAIDLEHRGGPRS